MSVYLYVADGRPNGWADQGQTWHRDSCWPRECFSSDRPARAERIRARSAINTADKGPQGRDNRARSAINLRPEDGYLLLTASTVYKYNYLYTVFKHQIKGSCRLLLRIFSRDVYAESFCGPIFTCFKQVTAYRPTILTAYIIIIIHHNP